MAKKNGNGEGGISRHKGSGLYMARYTVHTPTGPKRKTLYGKTRREVDEKLTKAKAERDTGFVFDADNLTLGNYLDRWINDSVRDTVRQRTWERYEQIVRVHIKPALGRVKLKNITPTHARALYREKLDTGLAPRTVNYIHTTLSKALKDAVADGLITRNPASSVKAPRPKKKEISPLSSEQAKAFLEAVRGNRFEAAFVVALHCGLREGEILGLKWSDVDLDAGTLQVRRTLSEALAGHLFEPPKNGKGRNVKLTARAVEALRNHLTRQIEEIESLGDRYRDQGLVFPSQVGTPMNAQNLTARSFKPLLKRAKLPNIRFHDLRHTFATLMLQNGEHPKVVQEMLGHATIAITMDTYSHVLPNMQRDAVDRLGVLLS
jgi:integrase